MVFRGLAESRVTGSSFTSLEESREGRVPFSPMKLVS
jgi:hypothetical protein